MNQTPAWFERLVSKDASAISDSIREQELLMKQIADDVTAARDAGAAIKAIRAIDFTPIVAAQLVAILNDRVMAASWSHHKHVEEAVGFLGDAHDTLGSV